MLRRIWVSFVFLVIGIAYLITSGLPPDAANLRLQIGVTFTGAALIIFAERLIGGDPNKDMVEAIERLERRVEELTERVDDRY